MSTLHIAFVTEEFPPDNARGGIATYVEQAAQTLSAMGHRVEVFASSPKRAHEEDRGFKVHWNGPQPGIPFRQAVLPAFAERHRSEPFDVVEGPEFGADAERIKAAFPGLPLVVRMHTPSLWLGRIGGDYPPSLRTYFGQVAGQFAVILGALRRGQRPADLRPFASWWRRVDSLEAAHARSAEIVASPCRELMDYAADRWRVPRSRVRLLPLVYQARPEFLAVPAGTHTGCVGFFGRLEQRKGVLDLARAIPRVLARVPGARFRLVGRPMRLPGSGIMADEAMRAILGPAAAAVEFRGGVPPASIPGELTQVDVCAFPSIWENFPNVCLEAMAAGRGIVGSSAGGMAEMLADGAGILVPPGDPARLADAIAALLLDPAARQGLGERARQRVLREYNAERIGAMMEAVYREAIAGAGRRRPSAAAREATHA